MQTSRLLSYSPSFDSFSSTVDLTAIAARVIEEFKDQDLEYDPHRDEDDFEFAFDCPSRRCSQPLATADEIFSNGQIRPLITYGGGIGSVRVDDKEETQTTPFSLNSNIPRRRRPALRKLMSEERDTTSSSSSEGEEDLIGVSPESYCVWTPKQSNKSGESIDNDLESKIKIKSNSAGFSKRWKLRNLLYVRRSTSERNEKIVFPVPIKVNDEQTSVQQPPSKEEKEREETKRQSYVPYRKDMIGILKNVNGLNRHFHTFKV